MEGGRWKVKCNACEMVLEHRDNRVIDHLYICKKVSQQVHNLAGQEILRKGKVNLDDEVLGTVGTDAAQKDAPSDATTGTKKRKLDSLDGYLVTMMSEKDTNAANLEFLRYESEIVCCVIY